MPKCLTEFLKGLLLCLIIFPVQAQLGMSGTYTINPTQPATPVNYTSFHDFIEDLELLGVTGPVTANVFHTTFDERIAMEEVVGVSVTNTITFQSDPSNVILPKIKCTNAPDSAYIQLLNTKHVHFKGFNLEFSPIAPLLMIKIEGAVENLVFENFKILGGNFPATNDIIRVSGEAAGAGLTFKDMNLTLGGDFLTVLGNSTNGLSTLIVENLQAKNNFGNGVFVENAVETEIRNCEFQGHLSVGYTGVHVANDLGFGSAHAIIENNIVRLTGVSSPSNIGVNQKGIFVKYLQSPGGNPTILRNNFIQSNHHTTTSVFGIEAYSVNNLRVLHNTIGLHAPWPVNTCGFLYDNTTFGAVTGQNLAVKNNIFQNNQYHRDGSLVTFSGSASGTNFDMRNNVYFAPNSLRPFNRFGNIIGDFSTWMSVNNDFGSEYENPRFLRPTDIRMESDIVSNRGLNSPFVQEDFEGDARPMAPSSIVDIGADEFALPSCRAPENLRTVLQEQHMGKYAYDGHGETQWILTYVDQYANPEFSGTHTLVNSNPGTISNLFDEEVYDVYVRAVCQNGDTSAFRGPLFISTHSDGAFTEYDFDCGPGFTNIANPISNISFEGEDTLVDVPFNMIFNTHAYFKMKISKHGGISFRPNVELDTSLIGQHSIYVFSQLLACDSVPVGVNSGIFYKITGSAPFRQVRVQWNKVWSIENGTNQNDSLTFQFLYDEFTQEYYFYYPDVDYNDPNVDFGKMAGIGINFPNDTLVLSLNDNELLQAHQCIHFSSTNCASPKNLEAINLALDSADIIWGSGQTPTSNYSYQWGMAGFDTTGAPSTIVNSENFELDGLLANTAYDVYVYSNCENGLVSDPTVMTFETLALCDEPQAIQANIHEDSLLLSYDWTSQNPLSPLTGFDIYYGDYRFDTLVEGSFVQENLNGADTLLSAFVSGGVYDVYIRAVCGNHSSRTLGPITVLAPLNHDDACDALNLQVDGATRYFHNTTAGVEAGEGVVEPPIDGFNTSTGWGTGGLSKTSWYTFQAPSSGIIEISGIDEEYDGQMAIYSVGNCSDFNTYQLIGANDNDVNMTSAAPRTSLCGLTPGAQYWMMHDARLTDSVGIYAINLKDLSIALGTIVDADTVVCFDSNFDLFSNLTDYVTGGTWLDLSNTNQLVDDSVFQSDGLAIGTVVDFGYEVGLGCANDTLTFSIEVIQEGIAGQNTTWNYCRNQNIHLSQLLAPDATPGGQWYDQNGNAYNDTLTLFTISGPYQYFYVVENDLCPNDTSYSVMFIGSCDASGVEENSLSNIQVYPVPAVSEVMIEGEGLDLIDRVEVRDMTGRIWKTLDGNTILKEKSIQIELLPSGVYFVEIINSQARSIHKIVKQPAKL